MQRVSKDEGNFFLWIWWASMAGGPDILLLHSGDWRKKSFFIVIFCRIDVKCAHGTTVIIYAPGLVSSSCMVKQL